MSTEPEIISARVERQSSQYVIPLPAATWTPVMITGPFPLSDAEWDHLMAVLDVMKPGLVKEDAPDA